MLIPEPGLGDIDIINELVVYRWLKSKIDVRDGSRSLDRCATNVFVCF